MPKDLIQIKAIVEAEFNVSNIAHKSRERDFCDARKVYSYVSRKCTNYSLKEIGIFIERDHTTILNSMRRCSDLMETNKEFLAKVRGLVKKTADILNIKTATYKEKIDIFWSDLNNEQQEEIYNRITEMYAKNCGYKKEIHYVNK